MIKIDKNQRAKLIAACNAFDETPINEEVIIGSVTEHKKTQSGLWIPEGAADKKIAKTPTIPGVVIAAKKDHPLGLKKGDLVRFTPMSAESIDIPGVEYTVVVVNSFEVKVFSHNIYDADDSMFLEPEPEAAN